MSTQINGPINVVRMEGEIDNVKKCIYIFMDIHYQLDQQLECDDVFAQDVNVYFAEKFLELNESNKKFDFFMEIYPIDLKNLSYIFRTPFDANHRAIYIIQVVKLFRKFFNYDSKENKVDTSEMFKNVRLHYMDVRYYFKKITKIITDLENAEEHIMKFYVLENDFFDHLTKSLITLQNGYQIILNVLNNPQSNKKKHIIQPGDIEPNSSKDTKPISSEDAQQKDIEYISYILDKMFNKYQNKNVQKIMYRQLDIMKHDLRQLINDCSTTINMVDEIKNMNLASRNKLVDNPDSVYRAIYSHSIRIIKKQLLLNLLTN